MLLHNYPYHREAGYLAQVFPHVYADLGLATHNVGSRAPAVLAEALEMVAAAQVPVLLRRLRPAGALLPGHAAVPAGAVAVPARPGWTPTTCRYADAERVTRLIATDNARRAYRLPG